MGLSNGMKWSKQKGKQPLRAGFLSCESSHMELHDLRWRAPRGALGQGCRVGEVTAGVFPSFLTAI